MTAAEKARKAHSMLLQAMQKPGTASAIATSLGVSDSTVSRSKTELDHVLLLIHALGFKVVSQDRICVQRERLEALTTFAAAAMADAQTARRLVWEEGEE
jgi:Holliday junction resolvase